MLVLSAVASAILAYTLVQRELGMARIPLIAVAVASIAVFWKPRLRLIALALVPVGPILDAAAIDATRMVYLTEVVMLAVIASWLHAAAHGKAGAARPPARSGLLLTVFGVAGLLALAFGPATGTADDVRGLRVLLLAIGLAWAVPAAAGTPDDRRALLTWWTGAAIGGLALIAVGGIGEFLLVLADRFHSEPGSFYRSSIGLAVHLAFFAPMALAVALGGSSRRWRSAGFAAWVLAIMCLPATASRAAIGSVAITTVALAIVALRQGRLGRPVALGGALLALVAVVLLVRPELAGESFAYKVRASLEGDFLSTRTEAWAEARAAIAARPLTGEGPAAWAPSMPLEMARRHGVPAALALFAAVIVGAVAAIRGRGRTDAGRGLEASSAMLGVGLGLAGLFLVGLAETGLGARATPLLAVGLGVAGLGVAGSSLQPCGDPDRQR